MRKGGGGGVIDLSLSVRALRLRTQATWEVCIYLCRFLSEQKLPIKMESVFTYVDFFENKNHQSSIEYSI